MSKPLFAPMWCFFAGGWSLVLGTLFRWRVFPFLHADTILSAGKKVPTAQAALFFSKWLYVAGAVIIIVGLVTPFITTESQRRYLAQLPRWQRFLFWPIRVRRDMDTKT
jgi:hypothetical protein